MYGCLLIIYQVENSLCRILGVAKSEAGSPAIQSQVLAISAMEIKQHEPQEMTS
jgi:hypothetical protein